MKSKEFLIMGLSGSEQTTSGQALALKLGWDFFDADDFHPTENITKMLNGIAPAIQIVPRALLPSTHCLEQPKNVFALAVSMSLEDMIDTIVTKYFLQRFSN